MRRYVIARIAQTIPLLCLLSVLTFGMLAAAPGDPALAFLQAGRGGAPPRPVDVARVHHNLGLDRPLPVRYVRWLGGALQGDFGTSYLNGRQVRGTLRTVIPPTLVLTGTALVMTIVAALLFGLAAGMLAGSWIARLISAFVLTLYSVPTFVTALLSILVFGVYWHLLPSGGMTRAGEAISIGAVAHHVILPAAVLALGNHLGAYIRLVEAAVVQTRSADFVQNAVARGLPAHVVLLRHVLRNSLVPFVAQLGASFGGLIAGAYAVEVIFAWPGMGRAGLQAATGRDYSLLMAIVLLTGVAVIAGNLLADLTVALLDPRVRLGRVRPVELAPSSGLEAVHAVPA